MRTGFILLLFTIAAALQAQEPPAAASVPNASVSGVVRDKTTGTPVKDYTVSTYVNATFGFNSITMTPTTKQITSKTDASGRYRLADLPPAAYRIDAQGPEGFRSGNVTRSVTLAGKDLEGIDFNVTVPGTISGKIVDENKDPQPNMNVTLVSKEYYLGATGYYFGGSANTNDLGEFTISNVIPGRNWYLMTDTFRRQPFPHAETPLNPKMRRNVARRTWYPSSPDKEGAAALTLRPGEHREGVDIEVKKSPSYCMSGITMSPTGISAMTIGLEMLSPSSGTSSSGGSFRGSSGVTTEDNGEFRICDLAPGTYRVSVNERNFTPEATYSANLITITDQDLTDLRYPASPRTSLEADVVLEGTPPQTPIAAKARLTMRPMFRTQMPGEKAGAPIAIPGKEQLTGLIYDDYAVDAGVPLAGLYISDITYGGRSVMYGRLRPGSSNDTSIRVTVGQDGAALSTKVTDKNGTPVPGITVIVMPQNVPSEGALASRIISGQTDQMGAYKPATLRPGKYYVVATEDSYDMTPESISQLWQSHTRYQEVNLEPKASAQVTLQPQSIR